MLITRLHSERRFHDEQASARARALRPHDYRFDDDDYLRHESWIAPAFEALGDLRGLRALDLGCGHGMASVVLARRGALVTACDLSLGYVKEARLRADANLVRTNLVVCDGERLPFADGSFDRIWGNAVLHHFDLRNASREIHRVLAPAGVAVFCEPWAGNRWLNWARQRLPYPGKQRTADETPLGRQDLDHLRAAFPALRVQGFQLLSMVGRIVKQPRLASGLLWCDRFLLDRLPHWQALLPICRRNGFQMIFTVEATPHIVNISHRALVHRQRQDLGYEPAALATESDTKTVANASGS